MTGIIFHPDFSRELKRKSFHLMGLIYPFVFHWAGLKNFQILLIVFWVGVAAAEIARLSLPAFNGFIFEFFGELFREKERKRPTGVFWMLSGALLSVFILDVPAFINTVLFYVVLGDLTASLVGKWIGGPTWFRSGKRLSGSCGCFIVCVCVGIFFLNQNYSWYPIFGGALIATLAEAGFIPFDDNFSILVAASIFFLSI